MTFSTVINCMDGRTQLSANSFMKNKFNCQYVDTITEAGPVKILSEQLDNNKLISILERVKISVEHHGSEAISIVAHYDCAGNPVEYEKQLQQLKKSVDYIKSQFPDCKVIGLWIGENWEAEEIFF